MDLCCDAEKHGSVRKRKRTAVTRSPVTLHIGPWITRLGRTQAEVAKAISVTEPYLSELISGKKKNPTFNLIADLADELGIPVQSLRRPPPRLEAIQSVADLPPDVIHRLTRPSSE